MSSAISNFPAQAPLTRCETMRKSRIEAAKTRERIGTAAAAEYRQYRIAAGQAHEGRRAHARRVLDF